MNKTEASSADTKGLRERLLRGGAGVLVVRLTGGAAAFGAQVVLARLMGTEAYGVYTVALSWVMVLALVSRFGADMALLRFLSAYCALGQWGRARGVLSSALGLSLASGLLLAALVAAVVFLLHSHLGSPLWQTFALIAPLVPILSSSRVRRAAMQSLGDPIRAAIPDELLREVFLVGGLGIAFLWGVRTLSAPGAAFASVMAGGLALAIGVYWLHRLVPTDLRQARPEYHRREWLLTSFPLFLLSGLHTVIGYTDVIMVGALLGPEAAGIYNVAARSMVALELGLFAINAVVAPMISALYAQERRRELQDTITLAAWGVFLCIAPVALVLGVWGREILDLFGPGFRAGYDPLLVLIAGQMVNALAGSVGFLMTMTGHHKEAAVVIGLAALLNIVLNAVLIPVLGMMGAAIATAMALAFWNLVLIYRVHRRLGIHSTIFAGFPRKGLRIQEP